MAEQGQLSEVWPCIATTSQAFAVNRLVQLGRGMPKPCKRAVEGRRHDDPRLGSSYSSSHVLCLRSSDLGQDVEACGDEMPRLMILLWLGTDLTSQQ